MAISHGAAHVGRGLEQQQQQEKAALAAQQQQQRCPQSRKGRTSSSSGGSSSGSYPHGWLAVQAGEAQPSPDQQQGLVCCVGTPVGKELQ